MDIDEGDVTPIDGGWCVKTTADGAHCIDVMKMMFNYRVQLTPIEPTPHLISTKGYCYFGHGEDENGSPRTMPSAMLAAMTAAIAWDGEGDPFGYDKKAY